MECPAVMPRLLLSLREMAHLTGGRWRHLSADGLRLSGIHFYLPYVTAGDLFVYLPREGAAAGVAAESIERAFCQGAAAALVPKGAIPDARHPLLEVADTEKALQDLATGASLKFDGSRVLVTGSHGKTGFKNQLHHLIRNQIPVHAYLGSANKELPVLRAIASLTRDARVFIVEVAVPGRRIGRDRAFFVRPDFCVITGIAPEHLKSHRSMDRLLHNKAEVTAGLRPGGRCLLNGDDVDFPGLRAAVAECSACEVLVFGSAPGSAGRLLSARFEGMGWRVEAEILGERIAYDLPLLECYAPLTSVGVLLQARLLGADLAACVAEYAGYRHFGSSGNLYRVPLGCSSFFIYDQSTRAELRGFEAMFELMSRLRPGPGGRKIVVMSELFDIEDNPGVVVDYPKMQTLMAAAGIDRLYTIKDFMQHRAALPASIGWHRHAAIPADIRDELLADMRENDMIFLRADPPARLDVLAEALRRAGDGPAEQLY